MQEGHRMMTQLVIQKLLQAWIFKVCPCLETRRMMRAMVMWNFSSYPIWREWPKGTWEIIQSFYSLIIMTFWETGYRVANIHLEPSGGWRYRYCCCEGQDIDVTAYLEFLLVVSFVIFELIISTTTVKPGSFVFVSDLKIKIKMPFISRCLFT